MAILKASWINLTAIFCITSSLWLFGVAKAFAAEEIIFRYGVFTSTLSVEQLEAFATKDSPDSSLDGSIEQGNVLNLLIRRSLIQEIPVSLTALDKTLNNVIGEFFLNKIGEVIQMPAGEENAKALRASIILAAENNKISILEIIKQYPAKQVIVDGEKLQQLQSEITKITNLSRFMKR